METKQTWKHKKKAYRLKAYCLRLLSKGQIVKKSYCEQKNYEMKEERADNQSNK